jgi:FkbM family methyltransferase
MEEQRERSAARNRGLQEAQGDRILFLDDDDHLEGHALVYLSNLLDQHPDAVAAVGARLYFDDHGTRHKFSLSPWRVKCVIWPDVLLGFVPGQGEALIQKAAILAAGVWNENLSAAEDHDFWLRLAKAGPVVITPRTVLRLRMHAAQTLFTGVRRVEQQFRAQFVSQLPIGERILGERFHQAQRAATAGSIAFSRGRYRRACLFFFASIVKAPRLLISSVSGPIVLSLLARSALGIVCGRRGTTFFRRMKARLKSNSYFANDPYDIKKPVAAQMAAQGHGWSQLTEPPSDLGILGRKPPSKTTRSPRRFLRDLVVSAFSMQPVALKQWLHRRCNRIVLGVLFRLEKGSTVVAQAGPNGFRFKMWLDWQGHVPYVTGTYEPEVFEALRKYAGSGDLCLDIGAHLGYATILMSKLVGPKGRVISFEPMSETFRVLRENVLLNGLTNVDVQASAVADRCGSIELLAPADQDLSWTPSITGYSVGCNSRSLIVPVVTLDRFLESPRRSPSVIKIDVEGSELAVLMGACRTLAVFRPVLLIEVHGWGTPASQEVIRFLSQHGYTSTIQGTRGREAFCLGLPEDKKQVPDVWRVS